ncbi:MAG: hypothetical protein LQ342_001176 [Letrouitia transgressa]|nr:MAG: hypothetical protein LQ342_001176 [Letrouitia transgressa]
MAPVNASNNSVSSIGLALARQTEAVDIPKPRHSGLWNGKETFAAVAARSLPADKHAASLPTPPNSISPSLPPHGYKRRATAAPPTPPGPAHLDSDLDLQDAVDHAKAQDRPQTGYTVTRPLASLDDLDAAGTITPGLLAKHHLPGILLDNGPLAIRHVMGYLTTSVPGFSGIPPAKARRLVVGALEGRGNEGIPAGIDGDVIFEKVGWGRWDARKRGQPPRDRRSEYSANGLQIPVNGNSQGRWRPTLGTSMGGESAIYSHDSEMEYDNPDVDMLENEADKMSLDGVESCESSKLSLDPYPLPPNDLGDVTDEEDWASIGAAALRQASFPRFGTEKLLNNLYPPEPKSRGRGRGPHSSMLAKSAPSVNRTRPQNNQHLQPGATDHRGLLAGPGADFDVRDREAVEALLRLGSM